MSHPQSVFSTWRNNTSFLQIRQSQKLILFRLITLIFKDCVPNVRATGCMKIHLFDMSLLWGDNVYLPLCFQRKWDIKP